MEGRRGPGSVFYVDYAVSHHMMCSETSTVKAGAYTKTGFVLYRESAVGGNNGT